MSLCTLYLLFLALVAWGESRSSGWGHMEPAGAAGAGDEEPFGFPTQRRTVGYVLCVNACVRLCVRCAWSG